MKERCIILLNKFKDRCYNHNNVLDTTNLNIDETVKIVENNNYFII